MTKRADITTIDIDSTDTVNAQQKSSKEAKALEIKSQNVSPDKDLRDDIAAAVRRVKFNSPSAPILQANLAELRALLNRQAKLQSQNKRVASSSTSSSDKELIVERDSITPVQVIDIDVTTFGTSQDTVNSAISKQFVDADGNRDNPERSTGIIPKQDRIATLEIRSLAGKSRATIREFFITGVREETSEKFQIVQTFGTDFIFFFNRKPLIYTINGIFYNSQDKQWRNNFRENYDNFLRGTRLVEGRNQAVLTYDDVVRQGYLLALNYSTESRNPNAIPFSFSMFITRESRIGDRREKELVEDQSGSSEEVVFP